MDAALRARTCASASASATSIRRRACRTRASRARRRRGTRPNTSARAGRHAQDRRAAQEHGERAAAGQDRAANGVAVIGPRADTVLRDWYGGLAPYKVTGAPGDHDQARQRRHRHATPPTTTATPRRRPRCRRHRRRPAIVFVGNHPTCGNAPPEPNPAPWATCPTTYEGREAVDRRQHRPRPVAAQPGAERARREPAARSSCWCRASRRASTLGRTHNVPAIVHIANSGQELGTAIADVLFGDYNPAGRTDDDLVLAARPRSRRRSSTTTSARGPPTGTSRARRCIRSGTGCRTRRSRIRT